jgi:transmembrane sensor
MITDELLFRYLSGEARPVESRRIESWLTEDPGHRERLDTLRRFFNSAGSDVEIKANQAAWELVSQKMTDRPAIGSTRKKVAMQIARIAAILVLAAGSALLWILNADNHTIRNREEVTRSVLLPDGTQVDLGPGSMLVYGGEFLKGSRTVRLRGEAYFDVTSDAENPFTVIAGLAKIKVTGTRFAVTAPAGKDEIAVTVRSGKVLFYNSETLDKNSFRMGLVAGEKGVFDPTSNRMDKTRDPYFQTVP